MIINKHKKARHHDALFYEIFNLLLDLTEL